jgi:hypothetical protein
MPSATENQPLRLCVRRATGGPGGSGKLLGRQEQIGASTVQHHKPSSLANKACKQLLTSNKAWSEAITYKYN